MKRINIVLIIFLSIFIISCANTKQTFEEKDITLIVPDGLPSIAIIPSNLALEANKRGLDYKIAATIGWGAFYLVSTEEINSIEDLKGKEIYNTGKGLTYDVIFKKNIRA